MFGTQGRVFEHVLTHIERNFGGAYIDQAYAEFLLFPEEIPPQEDMPDFDTMFVPFLITGFVPDPKDENTQEKWPTVSALAHWLEHGATKPDEADRRWAEAAGKSVLSLFRVDKTEPHRALDLTDFISGASYRVIDEMASAIVSPGQHMFGSVVTVDDATTLLAISPWVVPAEEVEPLTMWRNEAFADGLPDPADARDPFAFGLRELYLEFTGRLGEEDDDAIVGDGEDDGHQHDHDDDDDGPHDHDHGDDGEKSEK